MPGIVARDEPPSPRQPHRRRRGRGRRRRDHRRHGADGHRPAGGHRRPAPARRAAARARRRRAHRSGGEGVAPGGGALRSRPPPPGRADLRPVLLRRGPGGRGAVRLARGLRASPAARPRQPGQRRGAARARPGTVLAGTSLRGRELLAAGQAGRARLAVRGARRGLPPSGAAGARPADVRAVVPLAPGAEAPEPAGAVRLPAPPRGGRRYARPSAVRRRAAASGTTCLGAAGVRASGGSQRERP